MNIVENLTVKVTYYVSLSEIEIPKQIHEQLLESCKDESEININDPCYSEASQWLQENIQEGDCCEWRAEITDVSEISDEED